MSEGYGEGFGGILGGNGEDLRGTLGGLRGNRKGFCRTEG